MRLESPPVLSLQSHCLTLDLSPSISLYPLNYTASTRGLGIRTLLLYITAVYFACLSVILQGPLGNEPVAEVHLPLSGDRQGRTARLCIVMTNDLSGVSLPGCIAYIRTSVCPAF